MLIILSPAKTLDYDTPLVSDTYTLPERRQQSAILVDALRELSAPQLAKLMSISQDLATLNQERFKHWGGRFTQKNSRPAIFAFKGDVYRGLDVSSFSEADLEFAQEHLRILSGLHGVLRPLDRMQPYRLEMGTAINVGEHKDLYGFWGDSLARALDKQLDSLGKKQLVNLASKEYFKAVDTAALRAQVITPQFKEWRRGAFRIVSFSAKRARGLMAAWAIKKRVQHARQLKKFNLEGYGFNEELSSELEWVFTRDVPQK